MSIRKMIYDIIEPDNGSSIWSRVFDWIITSLVLASVVIVFVGTFELPPAAVRVIDVLEYVIAVVFTVEYLLRILTANFKFPKLGVIRCRVKYVFTPMAIIDLIAILPSWLPMFLPGTMQGFRAFRLVRLLRVFKLNRYFDAMRFIGSVIVAKKRELLCSLFFVFILMLVASLLMYSVEHDAQPDVFRNAFSGLWWAVATLTTVGYGDIYPVTVIGKLLGAVIACAGIAAWGVPAGIITSGMTEQLSHDKQIEVELAKQRAKDKEHDIELSRQQEKDVDHDQILKEQGELLVRISEQLSQLVKQGLHGHVLRYDDAKQKRRK